MKNCNTQIKAYERSEIRMSEDERADIYDKAKTNRKRIKGGLEYYKDPKPLGFRTQGSYAMRTMIRYNDNDYDVDDGVYFSRESLKDKDGNDKLPEDARKMVCRAAADDRFNRAPQVRDNCVRVYYNEGYHIDVPVYREIKSTNAITNEVMKTYEIAAKNSWKGSDPLAVTAWFKKQNSTRSSDATANGNDGQLVRIVRLLKAFSRSRTAWCEEIATGFSISKLICDLFYEQPDRDDQSLRDVSNMIVDRLKRDQSVAHPTLQENIAENGDARMKYLRDRLEENLEHLKVLDDPSCTHSDAMAAWDKFFNTDWFSKQPDPDEDDDLDRATTSTFVVKRGETRYAKAK